MSNGDNGGNNDNDNDGEGDVMHNSHKGSCLQTSKQIHLSRTSAPKRLASLFWFPNARYCNVNGPTS